MDLDKSYRKPGRAPSSRTLAWSCRRLAGALAMGRWKNSDKFEVSMSRSVTEYIGDELEEGDELLRPIITTVALGYTAQKVQVYRDNNRVDEADRYTLTAAAQQDIEVTEMPSSLYGDIKQYWYGYDEDDMVDDTSIEDVISELEDANISREHEVTYAIDDKGRIDQYSLAIRYMVENDVVSELEYDSLEAPSARLVYRSQSTDDWSSGDDDVPPESLQPLTDEAIASEVAAIDDAWLELAVGKRLREELYFGGASPEEHRTRALAILAMISSGMFAKIT